MNNGRSYKNGAECEKKTVARELWFTKSTRNIQNEEKQYITIGANLNVNGEKNYQEKILSWVL